MLCDADKSYTQQIPKVVTKSTIIFRVLGARGGAVHQRRKVAGSIPDDVFGFFNLHNPSGRPSLQKK
jgi:hypothetical protein